MIVVLLILGDEIGCWLAAVIDERGPYGCRTSAFVLALTT